MPLTGLPSYIDKKRIRHLLISSSRLVIEFFIELPYSVGVMLQLDIVLTPDPQDKTLLFSRRLLV